MSFWRKLANKIPESGRLSSIPASIIDQAYLHKPAGLFNRIFNAIYIRAVYLTMLIPAQFIDLFVSMGLGIRYAFGSFFVTDDLQEHRLQQQRKYGTIFSKNLYALLAAIFGLISPKLVAFYFTPDRPESKGTIAAGGLYKGSELEVKQPETISEVQEIIVAAAAAHQKVMPVGAGLSQGQQFLPADEHAVVLDLGKLNKVEIRAEDKVAIVGAGAIWADIQKAADPHRLALEVMQASNVFSVGGSIGTNIHGWAHRKGALVNVVRSLKIINAQGELQQLTPEDELFYQVIGGFGLLGIVVEVEIQLIDNHLVKEMGTAVALDDYPDYFLEQVLPDDTIKMHLYRLDLNPNALLSKGFAVNYVEAQAEPVQSEDLRMESNRGSRLNQIAVNMARRIGFARKIYSDSEEKRVLANDSPALSINKTMQPPVNAMFHPANSEVELLQEFFLPKETLVQFIKNLGRILMDHHVVLLNASVRFVLQHEKSLLSYAPDGDRFAVVLCFNQALDETAKIGVKKWIREAQELAVQLKGTYYLPYQAFTAPEVFSKAYPKATEFVQLKKKVDPEEMFVSGFYKRYLEPKAEIVNHFKKINAHDFGGFLTTVLHRVDVPKLFSLLEDIMSYCDTHEEIYTQLCKRMGEVMPNPFTDFQRILGSLSAIKEDLTAQAHALIFQQRKVCDGLVEIGYPGRFVRDFKGKFKVTGKIVAVYEQPSITDYIQTGIPRPYDEFVHLDYKAPSLASLPDNSADIITCYVGLHHFPEDKLSAFLNDVRRVLREGGHFLLVDHDVVDEQSYSMAFMAHTIFNAVNGVPVEEELSELRNFRSMEEWKACLDAHGLACALTGPDVPLIRHQDPSRNRMMSFTKGLARAHQEMRVAEDKPANGKIEDKGVSKEGLTANSLFSRSDQNGKSTSTPGMVIDQPSYQ
ncbi:MAG: hypothetical protein BGO90_01430 [Legionella sp. 40-6]|nr:FAD-binding protein [Legionella sp.]OJY48586.1 MAG: hypothetical protein BGO90_01430 [Legionella sp. 40-6]